MKGFSHWFPVVNQVQYDHKSSVQYDHKSSVDLFDIQVLEMWNISTAYVSYVTE